MQTGLQGQPIGGAMDKLPGSRAFRSYANEVEIVVDAAVAGTQS